MRIASGDLLNLSVYTASGQHLGRVAGFEIDLETHSILSYHISTGLIKGLWHQQLTIHPRQIISVSKDAMIVEDNAVTEPAPELGDLPLPAPVTK